MKTGKKITLYLICAIISLSCFVFVATQYPIYINTKDNQNICSDKIGYMFNIHNVFTDKDDNIYLCFESDIIKIDKNGNFLNTYYPEFETAYKAKVVDDKIQIGYYRAYQVRQYDMAGNLESTQKFDIETGYDEFEKFFEKDSKHDELTNGTKIKCKNTFGYYRLVNSENNEVIFKSPISVVISKYFAALFLVFLVCFIYEIYKIFMAQIDFGKETNKPCKVKSMRKIR